MKAERRHELQTNALDHLILVAPDFFKRHGTKLLLVLTLIVLGIVFMQRRRASAEHEAQETSQKLSLVRVYLDRVRTRPGSVYPQSDVTLDLVEQAKKLATDVLDNAKDPAIKAQAYVALGDCFWAKAHYPGTNDPDATAEAVKKAEAAYTSVLSGETKDEALPCTLARFGLAAIAEERGFAAEQAHKSGEEDWAKARQTYQAIIDDPQADAAHVAEAKFRSELLGKLREPVIIEPATRPAVSAPIPSLKPTLVPTTAPTTAATTRPIAPFIGK